jgi:hypothetical protein
MLPASRRDTSETSPRESLLGAPRAFQTSDNLQMLGIRMIWQSGGRATIQPAWVAG